MCGHNLQIFSRTGDQQCPIPFYIRIFVILINNIINMSSPHSSYRFQVVNIDRFFQKRGGYCIDIPAKRVQTGLYPGNVFCRDENKRFSKKNRKIDRSACMCDNEFRIFDKSGSFTLNDLPVSKICLFFGYNLNWDGLQ